MQEPSQTQALIGHAEAKKQFQEAFESGRLHHAWLLVGQEGIGKASLAYLMAHMILSGGENNFDHFYPENPASRLIFAESHPDLLVISRPADEKTGALKDQIPVSEARKLSSFLRMTSSYGQGRVALIDEAHRLNRNGQNAILKMIEEPPTGATIILTATTVGSLLPTIKSRCRLLRMEALSPEEMDVIFARLSVDVPEEIDKKRLFTLAEGSVGMALRILETEALPLFDEVLDLISTMPTMDTIRLHRIGDIIGRKAERDLFQVLTSLITEYLRKSIKKAVLGKEEGSGEAGAGLPGYFIRSRRLDKALELWENTSQRFESAESANLDQKLVFITAMTEMAQTLS